MSNHTQVLLCIDRDPDARLRDIAGKVGITERATQRIVNDLIASGHLKRNRVGRRNHYSVNRSEVMRHPAQGNQDVGTLLDLLKTIEPETPENRP